MDVDRFLWMLAVEILFLDDDGYLSKAGDYLLYFDVNGRRLHPIQHDGNETFSRRGFGNGGISTSPLYGDHLSSRPLTRRLYVVPHYRQRYLAHLRTLLQETFHWDYLGPKVAAHAALIDAAVRADPKKLTSYPQFQVSVYGDNAELRRFVNDRRNYLLRYPEVRRPTPVIKAVYLGDDPNRTVTPMANSSVRVSALVGTNFPVASVTLFYASDFGTAYSRVQMSNDTALGADVFTAQIPGFPAGKTICYYVAAAGLDSAHTLAFSPAAAEVDVYSYCVGFPVGQNSSVVINELMANNNSTVRDPQGDYDDWIELLNLTDGDVDLSGCYLTDHLDRPRKWLIPDGTVIPAGGYLLVWADEDSGDTPGLHANFKLASAGEGVWLFDTDERGNTLLDSVTFSAQHPDIAYGRSPDGTGQFRLLSPSPGRSNP